MTSRSKQAMVIVWADQTYTPPKPPKPRYYREMLDGIPRFGDKIDAVRLDEPMAQVIVRQLAVGFKRSPDYMPDDMRYGTKAHKAYLEGRKPSLP